MALQDELKSKWQDLSPRTRTILAVASLFSFLIIVGSFVVGGDKQAVRKKTDPLSENKFLLPKGNDNTPEQLSAQIAALGKNISSVADQLNQEKEARKAEKLQREEEKENLRNNTATQDVLHEVRLLNGRLDDIERRPRAAAPAALSDPLPGYEPNTGGVEPVAEAKPEAPKLRVTGVNLSGKQPVQKRDEKPAPALAAGSFFESVLLNGMDAPTSATTQKNPVPTTLRVKTEAMLPNKYRVDIKECFVLASGYGVLSSERAMLRTETMSCVRNDGKILETKIEGYIVGEDGRVGMRGRLVSKQGQMIAKTLVAGGLSGFAQAMTPQSVPQLNLDPGSTVSTQTADTSSIFQTGVAKGFSTSANEVAKFYMEMAREMTPVVEVDAGRKVTIVLVKGFELK